MATQKSPETLAEALNPTALENPNDMAILEGGPGKTAERKVAWYEPFLTSSMFFAFSTRSNMMTPLLLPLLVQSFVGEAQKGSYFGILRLCTLMMALMVQAIAGMLSDRSTSKLGRRRPFILAGNLLDILSFIAIGFIATRMSGMNAYWVLLMVVVLSMIASNLGHGAAQGLIPDMAPKSKYALFSAVKSLLEVPLPIIFVFLVIKGQIEDQQYWAALFILIGVYAVCTILTMLVKERPQKTAKPLDSGAIWRIVGMTAAFAAIIFLLGLAVKWALPLIPGRKLSDLFLMGALGISVMLIAVILGVFVSLRISLGQEAKKQKNFTWWVINRLAFIVGVTNLSSFLLYFVQERFASAKGAAAVSPVMMLMGVLAIALLIASALATKMMAWTGIKRLILISGLMGACGSAVVVFAPTLPVMVAGGFICGLAMGFFYAANWAMGVSLVPKEEAGRYLGLSNLAGAGAGAVGAYLGGPIGDAGGFTLLMSLYGLMFLFSTLALTQIKGEEAKAG
ncbi:MAG: MFS transporter [Anaerolineaceae bacterium]|nr:MFS transporter [Anaerolineaceae bacterium]